MAVSHIHICIHTADGTDVRGPICNMQILYGELYNGTLAGSSLYVAFKYTVQVVGGRVSNTIKKV